LIIVNDFFSIYSSRKLRFPSSDTDLNSRSEVM